MLLTFAAIILAWIVFRAPELASARNVLGGFVGLGHSAIVSFSPLAGGALLLLFGLVWFMPNSMEMPWRHESGADLRPMPTAGAPAPRSVLAADPSAGRALRVSLRRRGAGAVEPQTLHLFPVLNHGDKPLFRSGSWAR